MDDSLIFFDRYGREHYCEAAIPSVKEGFFALLVKDGRLLLTYPPHSDVGEFPGGSRRRKESVRDCLFRKLYEETGVEFMLEKPEKSFEQTVRYFADDEPCGGMFYLYQQKFMLYDADNLSFDVFRKKWKTPENGEAEWVELDDILNRRVKLNFVHELALQALSD